MSCQIIFYWTGNDNKRCIKCQIYKIYLIIIGELTTVSMGTTTQPSTIEVTTATECVKEKVVLDESNIKSNDLSSPLSTSDKDALQEKDDNKFVETNESIMVLLIEGLDEEVNGVKVSGDGIATITVKYNLPDNPEFITVQVNECSVRLVPNKIKIIYDMLHAF